VKFRHPDFARAAGVDVRPALAGETRIKFKEELLPRPDRLGELRSIFSHNSVLALPREAMNFALQNITHAFPAFRAIDGCLRKEAGCGTELDYTEQTSWLLFLKYLDGLEDDRAAVAAAYAIRADRMVREGPGWTTKPAPKTTPAPAARHTTAQNKPTAAGSDHGKTPGLVRPGASSMGIRPDQGLTVAKCPSCGGTINPVSLDCRCTR